ncbi:hypothetical protein ASE13_15755 [Sphingomonas sp. Root241]|nr:hypothetical protein ASE13_15755 [Sphingomonas sp. Root241]
MLNKPAILEIDRHFICFLGQQVQAVIEALQSGGGYQHFVNVRAPLWCFSDLRIGMHQADVDNAISQFFMIAHVSQGLLHKVLCFNRDRAVK